MKDWPSFIRTPSIHEKEVVTWRTERREPSMAAENRFFRCPLFAVDAQSPYYHEENKGSIFYAESWALTHYLFTKDPAENDRIGRTRTWFKRLIRLAPRLKPLAI